MEITFTALWGFMIGAGWDVNQKQLDIFIGIIGITFKWDD